MSHPELDNIDIHRYGYPTQPATRTNSTPRSNAGLSLMENKMDGHNHIIQYQAGTGSRVDQRFLMLSEFSRDLYSRRSELFEKLFPGLHDDFIDLLKRIDAMLLKGELNHFSQTQTQVRNLPRSLSVGSPRTLNTARGEEDFRLRRFKVRTLVATGGGEPGDRGGGSGGQSDTKNGGAN